MAWAAPKPGTDTLVGTSGHDGVVTGNEDSNVRSSGGQSDAEVTLCLCMVVIPRCAGEAQGILSNPQRSQLFGVAYRLPHAPASSPSFFHSHYLDRMAAAPFAELCR